MTNARESSKTFEDLVVWQKAHQLVLAIYRETQAFPKHETYGLTSQLRRAVVSVPANIAEGFKKRSAADKLRFMNIAQGSLEEVRYYLIFSRDLSYSNKPATQQLLSETSRLLEGYMKGISRRTKPAPS